MKIKHLKSEIKIQLFGNLKIGSIFIVNPNIYIKIVVDILELKNNAVNLENGMLCTWQKEDKVTWCRDAELHTNMEKP